MKTFIKLILFTILPICVFSQGYVSGRVVSSDGKIPLAGASVIIKGALVGATADSSGHFRIRTVSPDDILVISFIGYVKRQLRPVFNAEMRIELGTNPNQLGEVVVSSGYQQVGRERSTGSFVHMDQQSLNQRVSPDIISRLADNVPGLIFNRSGSMRQGAQSPISIRGENTIFGKQDPLIVLDNFPYTGDLNLINPNDIESVTVLKDAAAASIWGAQSANGVIVITTKKGSYNQPIQVSFNSNLTSGARPDLFYQPVISPSDLIDTERMLFGRGYYSELEKADAKTALSPVVELLIAKRDGKISGAEADAQIEAFRKHDNRNDISKYLFRKTFNQQYAINVKGGGASHRYFVSAGYDRNLSSAVGNDFTRTSVNASNSFTVLKQKLDVTSAIYYSSSKSNQNALPVAGLNIAAGRPLPGYIPFTDAESNPAYIPHGYREAFIDDAMQKGLLDWRFSPQQELAVADNTKSQSMFRMDLNANYHISSALSAQILYQFNKSDDFGRNRRSVDSWYTRDLINRFTSINQDGSLSRPVPLGDALDVNQRSAVSNSLRAQLNYDKTWGKSGSLTALAGAEIRAVDTKGYSSAYYGYDNDISTNIPVSYQVYYPSYVNPTSTQMQIPYYGSVSDLTDRYLSYYGNAAYTYNGRYTVTASARLDQSNLFGVKTNQKGVPLYSAGLSWKLSKEQFYHLSWLPYLALRATYGYNGSIDKSLSAYTTASFWPAIPPLDFPYASVLNPPNPQLRWERTRIVNLGLDLRTKGNRITASMEYYFKDGIDLIGDAPFAPQTGIVNFRGNTASTKGHGLDLNIRSINFLGNFTWETTLLNSYAADKVSAYLVKPERVGPYFAGDGIVPTEGKPLYSMFSLDWAGLDPSSGDPQGYFGSELSKNYTVINTQTPLDQLVYHGSKRPVVFGAVRNTFSLYGFTLSANISYRLGYYVRRPSVSYASVLQGNGGHGDYYARWQKPGDELHTNVPSMPQVVNTARDAFYSNASVLVQRGDHIRFQDINLSYTILKNQLRWLPFSTMQIYVYANNIGLLYKKMDGDLDPDYLSSTPPAKSIAAGLKIDF
jgi:TonB-linked SusC/RagA family outer membrane protein